MTSRGDKRVAGDVLRRKGPKGFVIEPVKVEALSKKQEQSLIDLIRRVKSSSAESVWTFGLSQCVKVVEKEDCQAILVARTEAKAFVDHWVSVAHLHGIVVCFLPTVDSEALASLLCPKIRRCGVACFRRIATTMPSLAPLVLYLGALAPPTRATMRPKGRLRLLRPQSTAKKKRERRKKKKRAKLRERVLTKTSLVDKNANGSREQSSLECGAEQCGPSEVTKKRVYVGPLGSMDDTTAGAAPSTEGFKFVM
eukprot:GEMP01070380.1.p1 GENE.GEMP01070380.1~~GEMP01070380.1.p1  ORF type:complete len:253 (+),score=81.43 GEMP01070380.1:169-927(+)